MCLFISLHTYLGCEFTRRDRREEEKRRGSMGPNAFWYCRRNGCNDGPMGMGPPHECGATARSASLRHIPCLSCSFSWYSALLCSKISSAFSTAQILTRTLDTRKDLPRKSLRSGVIPKAASIAIGIEGEGSSGILTRSSSCPNRFGSAHRLQSLICNQASSALLSCIHTIDAMKDVNVKYHGLWGPSSLQSPLRSGTTTRARL